MMNNSEHAPYETSRVRYYITEWKKVESATYNPAYGAVGIVRYHILHAGVTIAFCTRKLFLSSIIRVKLPAAGEEK